MRPEAVQCVKASLIYETVYVHADISRRCGDWPTKLNDIHESAEL